MTTTDMHFDFKNVDAVAPAMGNHLVDRIFDAQSRAICSMSNDQQEEERKCGLKEKWHW